MPLSSTQKTKIKDILTRFRCDVRGLVKQHKQTVTTAVENQDKAKAEEIKSLIQQTA